MLVKEQEGIFYSNTHRVPESIICTGNSSTSGYHDQSTDLFDERFVPKFKENVNKIVTSTAQINKPYT